MNDLSILKNNDFRFNFRSFRDGSHYFHFSKVRLKAFITSQTQNNQLPFELIKSTAIRPKLYLPVTITLGRGDLNSFWKKGYLKI